MKASKHPFAFSKIEDFADFSLFPFSDFGSLIKITKNDAIKSPIPVRTNTNPKAVLYSIIPLETKRLPKGKARSIATVENPEYRLAITEISSGDFSTDFAFS